MMTEAGFSGRGIVLLQKQKAWSEWREWPVTLRRPRPIFVDPCAGTLSTAKACILLPRHRCFVGCEVDTLCYEEFMLSRYSCSCGNSLMTIAKYLVPEVQAWAKVLVSVPDGTNARRKMVPWDTQCSSCLSQSFRPYHPFPLEQGQWSSLYEKGKALPLTQ